MKITPKKITHLKENEVFVFGTNISGFHGAGSAGYACRGVHDFNWRSDSWFLDAMKSPKGSDKRIGKWAIYGEAKGLMKGKEGHSYGIVTIVKPGVKRSISIEEIKRQVDSLLKFAQENSHLEFLITLFGCHLAGYSIKEIATCFDVEELKNTKNVSLPEEFLKELKL